MARCEYFVVTEEELLAFRRKCKHFYQRPYRQTRQIQTESLKVPRPANAFMLYANENRKKMAQQFPLDSNKEISKRLGNSWKLLDQEEKNRYFILAKQVDAEHKRKYPDYVYNPKEARLRKAMREANRERALGVSMQQHSPRGGRRSQQPWSMNDDEQQQLMMTPSHSMRGVIASPMHCGSPGFPIPTPGNNQFMHPMQNFSKNMHIMPHNSSMHGSNSFLQPNPIAQLQHQADMWSQYQEPIRPTQPEVPPPYLLPSEMPPYQPSPSEMATPEVVPQEKPVKMSPERFPEAEVQPPAQQHRHQQHTNAENVPPPGVAAPVPETDKLPLGDPQQFGSGKVMVEPLLETRGMHQTSEPFLPTYQDSMMVPGPYDKTDDLKMKKPPMLPHLRNNIKQHNNKALPDFNEAFGTTERGRFQSPPDPRLGANKGYLDYFFPSNGIKFEDYQI